MSIITWITSNWPALLAGLWALDQVLVSFLGHSTLLDEITSVLKGLGGGAQPPAL